MASGIFVNDSGRILVSLFFWIGKRVTTLLPIFFYHKLAQSLLTMGLGRVVTPPEKRQPFQALDSIPVQPGIHLFYPKVGFTKKKGFSRFNLVASWKRKYRGKQEDEPWYLLTNLPDLKSALEVYSKRYGIEAMFKDCKTGGYNARGLSSITG